MKLPLDKTARKFIAQSAGVGIARMRARAGLSQEDVATALEIGSEAVSRLERGVSEPTVSRLVELAELFGCGIEDLLLPGSGREADRASAIAREIAGLAPKDRETVMGMVKQLADALRPRTGRRPG